MILTVTANPALDVTYRVDTLVPHGTHRVSAVAERAGGKGLNVARVLHALGVPVVATGLLGGATGARVRSLLAGGPEGSFVPIAGETRRTVSVADGGDATGFWEPGPPVSDAEWATFLRHFRALAGAADVVVLSGSLPPGAPVDGYATLIELAGRARTVLDASGEALRHGVLAGPDVVKPNAAELSALIHRGDVVVCSSAREPGAAPLPGAGSMADAAATAGVNRARRINRTNRAALRAGAAATADAHRRDAEAARVLGARAVVVSHGPDGLLAVTGTGAWRSRPPQALAGNPTGAGDACVAALARGLAAGTPWPDLLLDAVALSAAAVAAPVAGAVDLDLYRRIQPDVRTEEL